MWSLDVGNSDAYPDAPEGTARLFAHGRYVGTVDAAFALVICKRMNEPVRPVRSVRTLGGAL